MSEKYKVVISERLNVAIEGYLDVAKKDTQTLIDLIFNDPKPATKRLFGATWYNGIISQSIKTIRDYMSAYLNSSILELLVEDLLDTFLITYLTELSPIRANCAWRERRNSLRATSARLFSSFQARGRSMRFWTA